MLTFSVSTIRLVPVIILLKLFTIFLNTRLAEAVTVTKVFILRFLLKDRKRITESFTYIQRSPG